MRNPDDLLTTQEVHKLTGWSVTSVNRWALTGRLPYAHKNPARNGAYLFRRAVVDGLLRRKNEAA